MRTDGDESGVNYACTAEKPRTGGSHVVRCGAEVSRGAVPAPREVRRHGQQAGERDEPLPPATQGQPGGLVPVGRGGPREGAERGQADPLERRLLGVPLVPRDERESFEDEATARIMNEHFVNIKVDREERPDIDSIYMSAVQALTRGGGWPMTVFLTPDGAPFY